MTHIHIDNPHLKSPKELIDIANMLMRLAGATMVKAPDNKVGVYLESRNLDGSSGSLSRTKISGFSDEVDSAGVEWNPEIHSAKRTKTTDGLWRARRHSLNGEEIDEDEEPQSDFQKFMSFVVSNSDRISPDYLMQVLSGFGIESVVGVQEHPEHIENIMSVLQEKVYV